MTKKRAVSQSLEEAMAKVSHPCKVGKPHAPDSVSETFLVKHYDSPLGRYILVSSQQGVVCVATEDEAGARLAQWKRDGIRIQENGEYNDTIADQLTAYFRGKLRQFSVSLDLRGTPFQREVWRLLCDIPYGETRSYRQLAQALGRPNSVRAVGQAVGSNPVSIIVPCHRVIGSDGNLTGYAGRLHRKQALLDLEATVLGKGSLWHP